MAMLHAHNYNDDEQFTETDLDFNEYCKYDAGSLKLCKVQITNGYVQLTYICSVCRKTNYVTYDREEDSE